MNTYVIHNARLVAEPKTLEFGEHKLTELRVADNTWRKTDKSGKEPPARFVTLKIWGKQAEFAATLTKGTVIVAAGELGLETYTGKDGNEVSKDVMTVHSYTVVSPKATAEPDKGRIPF